MAEAPANTSRGFIGEHMETWIKDVLQIRKQRNQLQAHKNTLKDHIAGTEHKMDKIMRALKTMPQVPQQKIVDIISSSTSYEKGGQEYFVITSEQGETLARFPELEYELKKTTAHVQELQAHILKLENEHTPRKNLSPDSNVSKKRRRDEDEEDLDETIEMLEESELNRVRLEIQNYRTLVRCRRVEQQLAQFQIANKI